MRAEPIKMIFLKIKKCKLPSVYKGISQIYVKMWHKAISYIVLDVQETILSVFTKNIT